MQHFSHSNKENYEFWPTFWHPGWPVFWERVDMIVSVVIFRIADVWLGSMNSIAMKFLLSGRVVFLVRYLTGNYHRQQSDDDKDL